MAETTHLAAMMVVSREQMTTDRSLVIQTGCVQFSTYNNNNNNIIVIIIIISSSSKNSKQHVISTDVDLVENVTTYYTVIILTLSLR